MLTGLDNVVVASMDNVVNSVVQPDNNVATILFSHHCCNRPDESFFKVERRTGYEGHALPETFKIQSL